MSAKIFKKNGHWARVCKGAKCSKEQGKQIPKKTARTFRVLDSKNANQNATPTLNIRCTIRGQRKRFLNCTPDTGAEVTVCGYKTLQVPGNVDNIMEENCEPKLIAANNSSIDTIGQLEVTFETGSRTIEEKVIICKEDIPMLLSWKTCLELGIISKKFPKPIYTLKQKFDVETEKRQLLEEFANVFSNNQELKPMKGGPMKIHLEENARPYSVKVARQIPFMLQKEVKQELYRRSLFQKHHTTTGR